jgi:hypothetical protein
MLRDEFQRARISEAVDVGQAEREREHCGKGECRPLCQAAYGVAQIVTDGIEEGDDVHATDPPGGGTLMGQEARQNRQAAVRV